MSSYVGNSSDSSETFVTENYYKSREKAELNVPYAVCEIVVAVCAIVGNGLVIAVFSRQRKLRRRTNYYIISLATADLLVGLFAIPFAILASIGLPTNLYACLFTVSVLIVLCTISIFCLVAVSIDRYWAILYPMGYSRNVRTKTAIGIICICWIAGTIVGFLPLFGWNSGVENSVEKCVFLEVMDFNYLLFLYFATIIFPALLIAAFYAHIYRVVIQQTMPMKPISPSGPKPKSPKGRIQGMPSGSSSSGPMMLRLLGAAQKREVKATHNLARIVVFFIICWFPLYTINCVKAFCPECHINEFVINCGIILSHVNSVGNPILYACHLKDFRVELKAFVCGFLFPGRGKGKGGKAGGEVRAVVGRPRKVQESVIVGGTNGPGGVRVVLPRAEGINATTRDRRGRGDGGGLGVTVGGEGGDGSEGLGKGVRVELKDGFEDHVLYLREDEIIIEKRVNL